MITLADRIREARETLVPQGRGMGVMVLGGEAALPETTELTAGLPPEIAARIPEPRGPVNPANPSARCDFCPRVQAADMLAEIEPDRYACDGCTSLRGISG